MAEIDLVQEICAMCGIPFGVTTQLQELRKADGISYYCPNGHSQYYKKQGVDTRDEKISALSKALNTAQETIIKLKKERDDVLLELEIYKPVSISKQS
jgi:hypothetical protein